MRSYLAIAFVASTAVAANATGCGSNDSSGQIRPPPTGGATGGATGGSGHDAGGAGSGGDSGSDSGGTCPSWTTDIYPQVLPGGNWQCTRGGCHSGPTGANPIIDGSSPSNTYTSMQNSSLIKPGDTNPNDTQLYSLLQTHVMPLTGTGAQDATPQELQTIAAWVGCGSPDN